MRIRAVVLVGLTAGVVAGCGSATATAPGATVSGSVSGSVSTASASAGSSAPDAATRAAVQVAFRRASELMQTDVVPAAVRRDPLPLPPPGSHGVALDARYDARAVTAFHASFTDADFAAVQATNRRDLPVVLTAPMVAKELAVVEGARPASSAAGMAIGGGVSAITYRTLVRAGSRVTVTAEVVDYADDLSMTGPPYTIDAPQNALDVTATLVLDGGSWKVDAYDVQFAPGSGP